MFWMRAYPLRGEGGVGPWNSRVFFLGPVKWERAERDDVMSTKGLW